MILGAILSGLLSIPAGGLAALQNDLVRNWIGPAALIVVAAVAVKHLIKGEPRKMAIYAVAAILGFVIIYGAPVLVGGEDASVTRTVVNTTKNNINVATAPLVLDAS
jgi:hypothetical protein